MTAPETLTDNEIHAYIDGELDDDALIQVEVWLAAHPIDAAKVHAFQLQKRQMHRLYDFAGDEPVPERILDLIDDNRPSAWIPGWQRMAAGIVLLMAGAIGGWFGSGYAGKPESAGNQFVQRALNAHVVYAHDETRPVEVDGTDEAKLVTWLSGRLGHKLMTPNLKGAGFKFMGGRLVADKGDAAALFMYEDAKARRVSLYVRPAMSGGDTKFRFIAENGMVGFYWNNGPLTYALSGEMPRDDLLHLVQMVHDDLVSRAS
ncbi:MAG: anti-sigma factor [Rhodospirillales bacterium]|nr:anti-sigma factor [Rhodospirillales bacterium]